MLNGENVGPVTLFRAYPDGVDTFTSRTASGRDPAFASSCLAHNDYNRRIFERVHAEALAGQRRGDLADRLLPARPTSASRSWRSSRTCSRRSPTRDRMQSIVEHVLAARDEIDAEMARET